MLIPKTDILDGSTNYTLSRVKTGSLLRMMLRIGLFRERNLCQNRKASCDESPERHLWLLRLSTSLHSAPFRGSRKQQSGLTCEIVGLLCQDTGRRGREVFTIGRSIDST